MTGSADLAEELTQETFYQAVKSIGRYQGNGKISSWLCGIARNVLLAYRRKARREEPLPEEEDFRQYLPSAEETFLRKEEAGAVGFLTQPVLTRQALDNLYLAREALSGKLLGGIMPIVSQRNALFLQREVHGVVVDEALVKRYEGADRERGEEIALELSVGFARDMRESVDGYYLMTPFGRTGLICRIMDGIRAELHPPVGADALGGPCGTSS